MNKTEARNCLSARQEHKKKRCPWDRK